MTSTTRRRFTIGSDHIADGRVTFDREQTRHLARVLRLRVGDVVTATDGHGREFAVRIEVLADQATGSLLTTRESPVESPLALTLLMSVPRSDRMDLVVRATTELGVRRIVPVLTERTVVRLDERRAHERVRHWQSVAREAIKQSRRTTVPDVALPCRLAEALASEAGASLLLCLWEGQAPPLARILSGWTTPPASAAVLIGPEGGFSTAEVTTIQEHGWQPAHLGPRVLRSETAAIAAVTVIQFTLGDLVGSATGPLGVA